MLSNKPGPKDALSPISIGVVPRSGGGGGGGVMGEREGVRRKTRQERERERGEKKVERSDGVLE